MEEDKMRKAGMALIVFAVLFTAFVAVPAAAEPEMDFEPVLDRPMFFFDEEPTVEDTEEAPPVEQAAFDVVYQDILSNDTKDDIYDLLIFAMVLSIIATVIGTISAIMVVRRR